MIDLRKDHEMRAEVDGGKLYLKGKVVQVWWEEHGTILTKETWTSPDLENAIDNFFDMADRWKKK